MYRQLTAAALAATMFVSSTAIAAADANQGALAQGKPASVKQAEMFDGNNKVLWLVGLGIVGGGLALVLTGNNHGTLGSMVCPSFCVPTPTTTTTTTTTTTKAP